MKSKPQNRPQGFTLVEIMIVVAIIGLLATMAIPHFAKARQSSHQTACINNLRQIEGAVELWALELGKDSGQPVGYDDIQGYLRNSAVCPAGGTCFTDSYVLGTVADRPACSRQPGTHKLP